MKGAIIYKSKYGSTKQFAEWLQEETKFDLFEVSSAPKDLTKYNKIIIGTSIHAGLISLKEYIIKNWNILKDRNPTIMLTSATSDMRFINGTIKRSFSADIAEKIKVFPVGGRYLFNKMSKFDHCLVKFASFFTKNPESKKGMLTQRDDVHKENLKELIEYLKK